MRQRVLFRRIMIGMWLGLSIVGCQSVDKTNATTENPSLSTSEEASKLTAGARDALAAYNAGDKRLMGVQTRGVSVPGVDEKLLPVLRQRYGVKLQQAADVMKSQKDRDSLTEVFTYVRQYNGKIAELLSDEM